MALNAPYDTADEAVRHILTDGMTALQVITLYPNLIDQFDQLVILQYTRDGNYDPNGKANTTSAELTVAVTNILAGGSALDAVTAVPSLGDSFGELLGVEQAVTASTGGGTGGTGGTGGDGGPGGNATIDTLGVTTEQLDTAVASILAGTSLIDIIQANSRLLAYSEDILRFAKYVRHRDFPK
jgi:hypothetical protein